MYIADRITVENGKMGGRPCIRGLRITVKDVLEILASGMTHEEIFADYPDLEPEDFPAALMYAAREIDHRILVAAAE